MPLETNFNVSPFFDDFDKNKDFYRILFRPGVALQARELTQLQTILQTQIERFGDHIFKDGTIVNGINFQFNEKYDFVKLLDQQADGQPVSPASYKDLYARNSANLVSKIVDFKEGFQSRDPEISYIFLKYLNSGTSGNTSAYSNNDVLTIFSDTYKLFDVTVNNGGTSFSNSDPVQVLSALVVQSSNVASGDTVSQTIGSQTANVFVIESNTTFGSISINGVTYSNTAGYKILKVRPIFSDLTTANTSKWTIRTGFNIVQGSNTASVVEYVGTGASATLTTDGSGIITDVSLVNSGSGYIIPPYMAVRSSTGSVSTISLDALNYSAQVVVAGPTFNASGSTPVGNGYSFSITDGIIYHKGHFLKVDAQSIVVNAFSSNVNNVTVGLVSQEAIVNNNVDTSLLDNATGTPNFAAPGADRLKITPELVVIASANVASNSTFFPLVEFREGAPYKQFRTTAYNVLAKEFERRMDESNGDFVIDPFLITTKDQNTYSDDLFDLVVDPGLAYIKGKRVQTEKNTYIPVNRSKEFRTSDDETISLNYGSYVVVNEFAGTFDFKAGGDIKIYDTPAQYITNRLTTVAATGTLIGTAKIRSLVFDSGTPGTSSARYRAYIFDVRMNTGKSFKDAKAIFFDGTNKGIADIILQDDPTTGLDIAVLNETKFSSLVFPVGNKAIKALSNTNYIFRTSNNSVNIGSNGVISITESSIFPYGDNTELNSIQRRDLVLTPLANAESTNTVTSVTATSSNSIISGTGLTSRFNVGDFVKVFTTANTSQTMISQVTLIANATHMTLANTWTYATVSGAATATRFFPANIQIPLEDSRVTANLNNTSETLTINLSAVAGQVTFGSTVSASISYNVKKENVGEIHKNTNRGLLVRIDITNHPNGTEGPWCLGVPDVFRLNRVYVGSNSSVNTSSTDVTRHFFIDNGQKNDYYDHSYLVLNTKGFSLTSSQWILAEFDAFVLDNPTDAGFFTIESYDLSSNGASRTELGNTAINIFEVPEYRNTKGDIIDCRDVFDFRPRVVPTANITSTVAVASINPNNSVSFGTHDKLFPLPDSQIIFNYEYYLQRTDRVVVDTSGNIRVIEGTSDVAKLEPPKAPADSITIGYLNVPPYPSLPKSPSANIIDFAFKKTGSNSPIIYKVNNYAISEKVFNEFNIQPRRFTMSDIGKLERRIEDLEYYTSLNLIEKSTKDLLIPSAIDPSRNRFKNGFFVDQFNDYLQADTQNFEYSAVIDQEQSTLVPLETAYNLQCRFNYSNTVTANNAKSEAGLTEPGIGKYGEAVLTLPVVGEITLIDQQRFTSAVSGDGTNTKFVGDMLVEPGKFRVSLNAEIRKTGLDAGPPPIIPQSPVSPPLPPTPSYTPGLTGLRFESFWNNNLNLGSNMLPHKTKYPISEITGSALKDWDNTLVNKTFIYLGYFLAPTTGSYTFYVRSHQITYLWVGSEALTTFNAGNALIANTSKNLTKRSGSISLTAGTYYPLRLFVSHNFGCGHPPALSFSGPAIAETTNGTGYYFYQDFPLILPTAPLKNKAYGFISVS